MVTFQDKYVGDYVVKAREGGVDSCDRSRIFSPAVKFTPNALK
jgi:hypothetical protein